MFSCAVRLRDSRFIHAIINIVPVLASRAMAGTRPSLVQVISSKNVESVTGYNLYVLVWLAGNRTQCVNSDIIRLLVALAPSVYTALTRV